MNKNQSFNKKSMNGRGGISVQCDPEGTLVTIWGDKVEIVNGPREM